MPATVEMVARAHDAMVALQERRACPECGAEMVRYDGPTPSGCEWWVCSKSDCDPEHA